MQPQQHDPEAFATERAKIQNFVRTACEKLNWDLYPNDEVTGLVRDGLAKNRLEYGFQACPCYSFLSYHQRDAEGQPVLDAKGEPKKNMKVNCPCEPARVLDVPGTVTYADRAEMEQKTEHWPDRGDITDNPDGSVTLTSYHPGVCHCFLFTRKGEGKAPD
jgi:ferredoxin-thioredoxin reductase catalytic subunit